MVELNKEKMQAINTAISSIEKQYGKGTIMRLTGHDIVRVPTFSSGSLSLDIALGIGGYPKGRFVEIFGYEASGKTTLTLHAISQIQKTGGIAAFIDAEHALDLKYAKNLGVNIEQLLISQPDWGEQALDITENLVRSGAVDLIVIDSVAALTPKAEIEGDMGEMQIGLQARIMSQALRKLSMIISKSGTTIIFTNQIRQKIGVFFGSPETTTGGNALKFYASVRLDVKRMESIKDGEKVIGSRVRVKVAKNKLAPPFREAIFDIIYGEGVSHEGELIDIGVDSNVIDKSGAWLSWDNIKLGQGREAARKFLKENQNVARKIEIEVRKKSGIPYEEIIEEDAEREKKKK